MNSTISLSQIITRLSKATGADTNTCRLFVREFFASATSALAADSTVEIKGVGTFRRSTQADENSNFAVKFIPDATVADEANRAFSMFKAVEIPAGLELPDETEEAEETEEPEESEERERREVATISEPEQMPAPTPEPAPAPAPMPEHVEVSEPEIAPAPAMRHEPNPEPIVLPDPEEQPDHAPEPSFPEDETAETTLPLPPKQRNRAWIWVIVIALLAGAAIGIAAGMLADVTPPPVELPADEYPATDPLEDEEVQLPQAEMETENPEPTSVAPSQPETAQQSAPTPQPATSQEAVYETVSASNYLSSMARRHYGAQVYWVYIYEANADHLGHPDRIAPGTRLLIPPRSTFPQAASEREAREIAQRKANEIRTRYSR